MRSSVRDILPESNHSCGFTTCMELFAVIETHWWLTKIGPTVRLL